MFFVLCYVYLVITVSGGGVEGHADGPYFVFYSFLSISETGETFHEQPEPSNFSHVSLVLIEIPPVKFELCQ